MIFPDRRRTWHSKIAFGVLALLVSLAEPAQAALVFEQSRIHIESPAPDEKAKNPKPPHASLVYDIELRREDALKLEYIHTLNTLRPETGVMIALEGEAMLPLPPMKVYTPVDVLFITENGTVVQIMPDIVLGEMTQTLQAKVPVKALLFLKSGEAATSGIHTRDYVVGSMFTQNPTVRD